MSSEVTKIHPGELDAKLHDSTDLIDQLDALVPSGTPQTKIETGREADFGIDTHKDETAHEGANVGFEFEEMKVSDDLVPMAQTEGKFDDRALKAIQQAHIDNDMKAHQFTSAKEFMTNVMYQVPLSKLYKPISSCQFNESGGYCPIMVQIIDEEILKLNKGMQYLLQVWNIKGEMIFEKSLEKPVCNWNICGSKLMFLEETNSNKLWLVALFHDKKPIIYTFQLPSSISKSSGVQINSVFDPEKNNFTIPPETKLGNFQSQQNPDSSRQGGFDENQSLFSDSMLNKSRLKDFDRMKSLGEIHLDTEEFDQHVIQGHIAEGPSITEIFKEQPFIKRAPDKMLDYLGGYILLAYRNQIVYIDVRNYVENESSQTSDYIEIEIKDEDLDYINLKENFKIIAMQEIGSKTMSSIILENLESRQIRFLRIELPELQKDGEIRKLKFHLLGINQNAPTLISSPLLKYRSVAKTDPKTKKNYQVGIAIRQNGTFEVYSDFMLVNEHMNPQLQCVDVETDFQHFYLKFVLNSHRVKTVNDKIEFEIRQVRQLWRNRISFSTTRIKRLSEKWNWVLHRKISKFFRMYTQILNFNMYMLVSHRNMISVYDMTKLQQQSDGQIKNQSRGAWIKTINFGDSGQVRDMFIKKRDKKLRYDVKFGKQKLLHKNSAGPDRIHLTSFSTYYIICLIGTHSTSTIEIDQDGEITQTEAETAPGRIIRYMNDHEHKNGVVVLTDDVSDTKEYTDCDQGRLYNFPYKKSGTVQSLHCLKFRKYHTLLDSTESTFGECLSHDSKFAVMQSNKHVFINDYQAIDPNASEQEIDEKDAVYQAFKNKKEISVLICTSPSKNSCKLFPIQKLKKEIDIGDEGEKGKVIDSIKLITQNSKTISLSENDSTNQSDHLSSFFVNTENFETKVDHFAQVTENSLNVFDRKMKTRVNIEGLNIRGCVPVHDNYLYTISDPIIQPPTVKVSNKKNDDDEQKAFSPSGFYVYDVEALFNGIVQRYKLASSVGGYANLIDNSKFGDRFSFIQSFDNIVMIPFPHLNILNCVGMGHKSEYMIWREKNGFFTALDRQSKLLTWSLLSGKMLYSEIQHHDGSRQNIKEYEVYRADDQDIVYTQDFYNFPDYSLNLFKSKIPANETHFYPHTNIEVDFKKYQERATLKKQRIKEGILQDNFGENVTQLTADLFTTESDNKLNIDVINSQKISDLYHFKVMKLQTHEDLDRESQSSCTVLFHFFHELLQFRKQKDLENFDWDVSSMPRQRLYLSQNTKMMMKVTNNFIAIVYKRKNINQLGKTVTMNVLTDRSQRKSGEYEIVDTGQEVNWEEQYQITRFPTALSEQTSVPYLFSPNFKFFLDFNYNTREFVIKESATQFEYYTFPQDLFNTLWNKKSGSSALKIIVSRFKWEGETLIRIINKSNIDCIFELKSTDPYDDDKSKRYLKLISAVKIDNLHSNNQKLDSPHVLQEPSTLQTADVLQRLIRQSQSYKMGVSHALNKEPSDAVHRKKFNVLEKINKIDYLQKLDDFHASFDIELTFTWLNWRIMEMLESGASDINEVDHEQQIEICFNILPAGKSFLHMLAAGSSNSSDSDQIKSYHTTKGLFEIARKNIQLGLKGAEDGCSFEIPILPDIYGSTALDLTLGLNHEYDKIFFSHDKDFANVENHAMAEVIIEGLKHYGFMHSSFFIVEAITRATELGLPAVRDYLERRLKSIDHSFDSKTEHAFQKSEERECPAMSDYARMYTPIWVSESIIRSKLFDPQESLQPMSLLYLDMPFVFKPNKSGYDFITALTKCTELDIFRLKSVQIVIDCHASHWNRINYLCVGLPMLFNLLNFWYWSNIVLVNLPLDPDTFESHDLVCRTLLGITGFYLIFLEITAIVNKHIEYFNDLARLFNIITPILIMTNVFTEDYTSITFWTVQTWAALAIWFRALLYLRTISHFSWLIRMIVACVLSMRTFMVVLTIGIIAFADAFLSIDQIMVLRGLVEQPEIDPEAHWYFKFFKTYVVAWQNSFQVALGNGNNDLDNYREFDWFVFLLCCIFNIIIMLNLLIAIISETYQNVADEKVANGYQEKAVQISMMQDQLLGKIWNRDEDPNELVFIAKVISSGDIEDSQNTKNSIEMLQDDVNMIKENLQAVLEKKERK